MDNEVKDWKKFQIGKIFRIERPAERSRAHYNDGDVPFVASGNYNNGVVCYCSPKNDKDFDKGNCITVSPLDGSAFYQRSNFLGRGGAGSAIILLYSNKLNYLNGLFVATIIRRQLSNHTYNDQLSSSTILNETIMLPATATGAPDWKYMEKYMLRMERRAQKELDSLKNATCSTTDIDTTEWREFTVEDYFTLLELKCKKKKYSKALDVATEPSEEFNLPLVNAKTGNNGIMYWGREADWDNEKMCLDIVKNGAIATGDVYVQPKRTGVLFDAYLIKPNVKIDKYALFYIAAVLKKVLKQKYCYDDKAIWSKVRKEKILLPATVQGTPDFSFMSQYMKKVKQATRTRILTLSKI